MGNSARGMEKEHARSIQALDIILHLVKNYTETLGEKKTSFHPSELTRGLETVIDRAKIEADYYVSE